jgi:hypothetical protein
MNSTRTGTTGAGNAAASQSGIVTIRDLATNLTLDIPSETEMLRVPYDAWDISGPVQLRDGRIEYTKRQGATVIGQAASASLGDARPGERVLLREQSLEKDEPGWWLCEVVAVEGVDVS